MAHFEARVDGLLYKPGEDAIDLYEIKSSTALDKTDLLDVTFQAAILKRHIRCDHFYLLHLNKEYLRGDDLNPAELFLREDVTDQVTELLPAVEDARSAALLAAGEADPAGLAGCLTPKQCPCPETCFPDLPEFSIFDVPLLQPKKKRALLEAGILEAAQIPGSFDLNEKQRLVVGKGQDEYDLTLTRQPCGLSWKSCAFPCISWIMKPASRPSRHTPVITPNSRSSSNIRCIFWKRRMPGRCTGSISP